MEEKKPLWCSFCGKHQDYVQVLIAGPSAMICDECIALCLDIVEGNKSKKVQAVEKK